MLKSLHLFFVIPDDSEATESDEDHLVHNLLLQEQELDPDAFELAISDDSDHMINDFVISAANSVDVALRDLKKQRPRKHKNSTSSISSVSTSIKKVAIELQNSTANFVSGALDAAAAAAVPANQATGHMSGGSLDDFDDDNDFDDLLGFEDWEQMLDEDYISRFTTDFGHSYNSNAGHNGANSHAGMSQKTSTTPLAGHIQTVKLPVTNNSRLVPHISTMTANMPNKSNQPLVLVLSNSNSNSNSSASSSTSAAAAAAANQIVASSPMNQYASNSSLLNSNQNKLKANSPPSLTPIASPMCKSNSTVRMGMLNFLCCKE